MAATYPNCLRYVGQMRLCNTFFTVLITTVSSMFLSCEGDLVVFYTVHICDAPRRNLGAPRRGLSNVNQLMYVWDFL